MAMISLHYKIKHKDCDYQISYRGDPKKNLTHLEQKTNFLLLCSTFDEFFSFVPITYIFCFKL